MRVLIATHFFPPGHIGGTETLTLSLAMELQVTGHDVLVVCVEDWDTAPEGAFRTSDDLYQNVPVHRLHYSWNTQPDVFRYLYNNPEVERHFQTLLDDFKPDILHITSCYSLSTSIIAPANQRGIPVVFTATDFWFFCGRNTLLKSDLSLCDGPESAWGCTRCMLSGSKVFRVTNKLLPEAGQKRVLEAIGRTPSLTRRRGLRGLHGNWDHRFRTLEDALHRVDRFVTASKLLERLIVGAGVPREKVTLSPYGIDTSWAAGHQHKTPSRDLRFAFIGQIDRIKGPDLAIRAIRSLPREHRATLTIYGDLLKGGPYGRHLLELAGDDDRIMMAGTFDNGRMGEILSDIDVLLVPSIWYDFPLVIPSAFATRTPVIATNLSGISDLVIDEVDGLLFERGSVEDLRREMQRLIDEPELLGRLRAGIRDVKGIAEMTREYCKLYASLAPITSSQRCSAGPRASR